MSHQPTDDELDDVNRFVDHLIHCAAIMVRHADKIEGNTMIADQYRKHRKLAVLGLTRLLRPF